jgi:hypothetical protein
MTTDLRYACHVQLEVSVVSEATLAIEQFNVLWCAVKSTPLVYDACLHLSVLTRTFGYPVTQLECLSGQ